MNELRNNIVNKRDSIDGNLLKVESAAKNTLRICKDIEQLYKNGKVESVLYRCEDIAEFGQKILEYGKKIEAEVKKQAK